MAGKGKPGRRSKLTPAMQEALCAAFRKGATDKLACAANGLGLSTYYKWMSEGDTENGGYKSGRKVEFREAILRAKAEGDVELLDIVRRSSLESIDRMGGKLALELLARRHPDDYGSHKTVRHAGHDGGPVSPLAVDLSELSPEQLAALVGDDDGDASYDDADEAINDADNTPVGA